ncbi:MAG: TRAP transporter permease [Desulfarculaceae bacterium]|nr:TRAP transporter permease [Desulfarculaceae bacterium]MCF8072457.1 TRAP transporter permease [Desulfarculaceae bacterium]MCF8102918.1 TRAP transporter permease [Desulfarculaceae bacterium]MCF8117479.1 TRAP transporter permease [Desulfarculaceae bacterium]
MSQPEEKAVTPAQAPALARWLIFAVAVGLSCFHLYTAAFGVLSPLYQRGVHLLGLLFLCFMINRTRSASKDPIPGILDWGLTAAVIALAVFMMQALAPEMVLDRGIMGPSQLEIWVGAGLVVLILEGTRRSVGMPIVLVALVFLAYGVLGPYMPDFLAHKGYGPERLVSYLVWTTEGVFGIPIAVSATFVIVFIIFGAFLDKLGAGNFFISLALALTGRRRGGPALTSVVASGLMGSISGSSVSNVVTTGTFTIPLMKRTGYSAVFAGAVEAVASTGGQIMPPVMGAGAFVMAELLGTSYAHIALAAAIPAVLYFASVGLMVYFEAHRKQLKVLGPGDVPKARESLKKGWHLIIPLLVLVYLLVVRQLSPMLSGFYAICTLVITASAFILWREKRFPWREILEALKSGAVTAVPVALACATAGLVIGVVSLTGLGVRFTQMVIHLSGGVLWLGGLLTMVACIILGMGLPTTAAYIITAVLGVPALTDMGVSPLQAHMFIFYFAIISFITPPVAISAYAASGIAGTNAMKTGFVSFKLGLAGFIVPFLFLYSPSIVLEGDIGHIILNSCTALLGVTALAGGLVGWFAIPLKWWMRLVLLASAVALIVPNLWVSAAGAVPLAAAVVMGLSRRRAAAEGA